MGWDLYNSYSSARQIFDEADATLGFPLSRLCFEGPEEELTSTNKVQPALLATSVACLKAAQEASRDALPAPKLVAGHSLGEYTALVAANVLSLSEALILVRERGRLMYEAGLKNPGGMIAIIGISKESVQDICSNSRTEISNVNCPGQIIVSGATEALAEAKKLAKMKGARIIPLNVSGAFHSVLMNPVIAEFREIVSSFKFQPPRIPIMANVTARPVNDVESIKEELVKQLRNCIQWQQSVENMVDMGVNTFYEIGPGKVLSGFIKRINPELQALNISGVEDIKQFPGSNSPT